MTVLNLFTVTSSEVELLRPLVIGWLIIAFALSAIEVFWLASSSRKGSFNSFNRLASKVRIALGSGQYRER